MRFLILPLICLGGLCLPAPVRAQPAPTQAPVKAPVEIEASEQLEWLRAQSMYRATGDVKITRGDTVITGDTAEASYDPAKGSSALTSITVTGHVVLTGPDRTIHADKGVYDTATQNLVLTGGVITLEMPDLKVVAHDGMTYNALENKATATGKAEVAHDGNTLQAASVTAWLQKGSNALLRAAAAGDVVILHKTAEGTDIIQAQKADYDAAASIISLENAVKITRGPNHMQGDTAVINLKTGQSTLKHTGQGDNGQTGKGGHGRVRAIFSTESP